MEQLQEYLPYLIPVIIIQLIAQALSVIQLIKPETKVRGGNKLLWGVVIVAFQLLGVLVYHLIGKVQNEEQE